jgi:FMN phosphatase YigB (HAD superfamily)
MITFPGPWMPKATLAARMLRGMLSPNQQSRVSWKQRLEVLDAVDILSTDIFNTLLIHAPGLDAAIREAVGREISRRLHGARLALPMPEEAVSAALERKAASLRREARAVNPSQEISHRILYQTFLRDTGVGEPCEQIAEGILEYELDLHFRLTEVNAEVKAFIERAVSHGKRVIAVSDTYLGGGELARLLQMHGVTGIDRVYASCDFGLTKFHGNLYSHVLAEEGVKPSRLLHFGDNRLADSWSARQLGIRALHYRRRPGAVEPLCRQLADPALRLGFESLGPIFAAFCHLLLVTSRQHGFERLAFIARDGDLLRRATSRLALSAHCIDVFRFDYVFFSRRSTALPYLRKLDAETLRQILEIRADGPCFERLAAYLCLDINAVPDDISGRHYHERSDLEAVLGDPRLHEAVAAARDRQESVLKTYLQQEDLFRSENTALVDVGWRATIQTALNQTFAKYPDFLPLPGIYAGLWSESRPLPDPAASAWGLLGDARRDRSVLEGAVWQLAIVLEAVCRAPHGTVIGYQQDQAGCVHPVLSAVNASHEAERACAETVARIQEGILAYIDNYGASIGPALRVPRGLRQRGQWRAFRLACFPRRWEIQVLGDLVHTESHAEQWSVPLICMQKPSPLTSPRRWAAGLSSPWRAGYVAATGGPLLSLAFVLAEVTLYRFPGLRRQLQETARRWARMPSI